MSDKFDVQASDLLADLRRSVEETSSLAQATCNSKTGLLAITDAALTRIRNVESRVASALRAAETAMFDQFWNYIATHYNVPARKYTPAELIQALVRTVVNDNFRHNLGVVDAFSLVKRIRECEGEAAGVVLLAKVIRAAAPHIPEELMREYREALKRPFAEGWGFAVSKIANWAIETIGGESGGERERQQHLAQLKEQVVEAAVTWRNVPNLGTAMTLQSEIDAYLAAKEHPDG